MSRRYSKLILTTMVVACGIIGLVFYVLNNEKIKKFGPLRLGDKIPYSEGHFTFAPIKTIPKSKFYITIGEPDLWCTFDDCCAEGAFVKKVGGWLQSEKTSQPDVSEVFGLDSPDNKKKFKSIVIIGDVNSKIVGIYPGKGIKDIASIMELHSNLIGLSVQ